MSPLIKFVKGEKNRSRINELLAKIKNVTPPSLAVKCKYLFFLTTTYPYGRYVNSPFCKKLVYK